MSIIYACIAWYIVGCAVLTTVDDKEQRLYSWVKSCPIPWGASISVMLWHALLYYWLKLKQNS